MRRDYLYGTGYTVLQAADGYHFNSDTELLGMFMKVRKGASVLDIGCHSGALMLYAAAQGAAEIHGIDLFEEVTELARRNMAENNVAAQVFTGRVQTFGGGPYDVIVCNPPYFKNSGAMVPADPVIAAARHETELTLPELFAAVKRLLRPEGRFCMVHRASRLQDIVSAAVREDFGICRFRVAYRGKSGRAQSILLEFARGTGKETIAESPAYLDDRETFRDKQQKGNDV